MTDKPHKGRIEQWEKVTYKNVEGIEGSPTLIWGRFVGHQSFPENSYGHTSYIVAQDGNEIETRNSRYTLGEPKVRNVAELTDTWGSSVRIDVRPGTDNNDPQLVVVTVMDETTAAVTLNNKQAWELANALNDAVGGRY